MNKRLISVLAIATTVSGLVIGGAYATQGEAVTTDPVVIVQTLKHQGEVLDNHEARITNTENDVKDLQGHTATQPSPNNKVAPAVVTPAPPLDTSPDPTPAPVVVTAFEQIPIVGSENINCKLTYSDGTDYTFLWMIVSYNQGIKNAYSIRNCDKYKIGTQKEI